MTFMSIALRDWAALFYIGKWILIGFVMGALTMAVIYGRREANKKSEGDKSND